MMASGLRPARSSCSALRAIADIDNRLGGRDADIGLSPENAIADGEHARLHGAADLAGGRVEAEN